MALERVLNYDGVSGMIDGREYGPYLVAAETYLVEDDEVDNLLYEQLEGDNKEELLLTHAYRLVKHVRKKEYDEAERVNDADLLRQIQGVVLKDSRSVEL